MRLIDADEALERIDALCEKYKSDIRSNALLKHTWTFIKRCPTVEPCDDTVKLTKEAYSELCLSASKWNELQTIKTQKPKTGHWIDTDEWKETVDGFEQWGYFRKCSKCGYVFKFLEIDNYCPNCGCLMDRTEFDKYVKAEGYDE